MWTRFLRNVIPKVKKRSKNTSPRNEIIWSNRNIIIDGKAKSWIEKNILRVEDLLDNNGNFLFFNLSSEKFHPKTPFTIYFGLINSVPAPWKLAIKRTPPHVAKNDNNTKKISTKSREQNCETWFYSRQHSQSVQQQQQQPQLYSPLHLTEIKLT